MQTQCALRVEPSADIILPPAPAYGLTSIGGGCVTGKAAAFGSVTGQLMLMLNLNHTSEQEQKSEKSS